ncbi:hypothetical protein KPH14_003193 [Odynerus spinipes]|uniref:Uncharacterized protein n=1 Tax=Odynerus spinipes TaxID=1348599 RepID=A0AAD9VVC7_9HYME|nr:hypothetical protein KPH14_003193 [Odynerus spinipes]
MLLLRNILKARWMKFSHVSVLQYRCIRTSVYLSTSSDEKARKAMQKFKLKQAKMQRDDGLPTYLKGGFRDKVLFNITLILFIYQCVDVIWTIRELAKIY